MPELRTLATVRRHAMVLTEHEFEVPDLSMDVRRLRELRALREVAGILANEESWPDLYDAARLARNDVRCAAVIYAEDMYVPRRYSEETAARIAGMKTWLTSEFEHSGLRTSDRVFERLVAMLHDE